MLFFFIIFLLVFFIAEEIRSNFCLFYAFSLDAFGYLLLLTLFKQTHQAPHPRIHINIENYWTLFDTFFMVKTELRFPASFHISFCVHGFKSTNNHKKSLVWYDVFTKFRCFFWFSTNNPPVSQSLVILQKQKVICLLCYFK